MEPNGLLEIDLKMGKRNVRKLETAINTVDFKPQEMILDPDGVASTGGRRVR